jgi:hypothetical protein
MTTTIEVPIPDAERWARVRFVAVLLARADLDSNTSIIATLHAARLIAKDFDDVLDEAIDVAREAREAGEE